MDSEYKIKAILYLGVELFVKPLCKYMFDIFSLPEGKAGAGRMGQTFQLRDC